MGNVVSVEFAYEERAERQSSVSLLQLMFEKPISDWEKLFSCCLNCSEPFQLQSGPGGTIF